MRFFDTHAHYIDSRYKEEFPGGADALLKDVFESEVERIVNVGTNIENSKAACEMASRYEGMYAAVGIHPMDCKELPDVDATLAELEALLVRRKELKIVALGEIGLDYYWDADYKELQQTYFERQLELAIKHDLPQYQY